MKNNFKSIPLFSTALLMTLPGQISAKKSTQKPNVLFIMTDQQFADAMSFRMGNKYINTPTMDRMAKEGVAFTRAYANNPLSMPSRNAIFTGRYAHETLITENKLAPYNKSLKNMGQYFYNAGYHTAYYGKSHLSYKLKNIKESGFEFVDENQVDSIASANAINYLKNNSKEPFLLVVSYLNPHNICEYARNIAGNTQALSCGEIGNPPVVDLLPPLPSNFGSQANEPDGMQLMKEAQQVKNGLFPVANYTETEWRQLRWGYYRMIEKVDAQIGLLMDALKKTKLDDNTLIVFTSDHGDCAGAHGWNQKTVLYEESVKIPLIISYKGISAGKVSDKLVNTGIDILPTILDFAGIDIPNDLPGLSLKPIVTNKKVKNWREYVVAENNMKQAVGLINGKVPEMAGRMVRTDMYKYCVYSKGTLRESLIDMKNDPDEMVNLATNPAYHDILLKHRALLIEFGKKHNDTLVETLLKNNLKTIAF